MCMLVARCGWLANSAALCLISQSFAIFHRHSWCLKKIENKISLSNFNFSSLLTKRFLGNAPYSGLNLYLVPHVPSALSLVSCPYCLSCVSCLHTFSCIVSISLFTFFFAPPLSWKSISWVIIVGLVKNPQIHNNVVLASGWNWKCKSESAFCIIDSKWRPSHHLFKSPHFVKRLLIDLFWRFNWSRNKNRKKVVRKFRRESVKNYSSFSPKNNF